MSGEVPPNPQSQDDTASPPLKFLSMNSPTWSYHRLSMPPFRRVEILTLVSFGSGVSLGLVHGYRSVGLRFRAENAHRLPQSKGGWYFYHRAKNYDSTVGGVREAVRGGSRFAFWVGLFLTAEAALDKFRGANRVDDLRELAEERKREKQEEDAFTDEEFDWVIKRELERGSRRDFLSTTVAALAVASLYNGLNGFSFRSSLSMARMGLIGGLGYGLLQDGLHLGKGYHLAWLDFITGRVRKEAALKAGMNQLSAAI